MYASTLLFALLPVAFAATTASTAASASSTASSTASATSGIATITVGNGGKVFSPNSLSVAVGTVVEFEFYPTTHSVAQASFASPCNPLNSTSFFSGGFTTASGMNTTVFTITVNDTTPIWFYCGFPGHCGAGMVGVINPPADGSKTIAEYITAAKLVNTTVAPKTVQGGTVQLATAVKATSAGVEARGSMQWGLLALTGAVAAGVGSLIV